MEDTFRGIADEELEKSGEQDFWELLVACLLGHRVVLDVVLEEEQC